MITNQYVNDYINMWKTGKIILNDDRILLIEFIEKQILTDDRLYFDEQMINNAIAYTEKYFFPLQPFQKFLIAFVFLYIKFYDEDLQEEYVEPLFTEHFWTLGRGGGKNGLISAISNFMLTKYHGIKKYDITIVANSESQAKTSFNEVYDMVEENELFKTKFTPDAPFYLSKTEIKDLTTKSRLTYSTSNVKTKDGGREGCVIFDEVHIYEDASMVNVKRGGLGKVLWGRTFYIGTDGTTRGGFMDALKERANNILNNENKNELIRFFPFMCRVDEAKEIDDIDMWQKANPMFHKPLSRYARTLISEVKKEYNQLPENPSNREEFVTKRMNYPEVDLQKSVCTVEELEATNRPIPDVTRMPGVFAIDYASVRDFAACGILFKDNETNEYIWKTHSFALEEYLSTTKLKVPIYEWAEQGHLTILDGPTINPNVVVNWFVQMREIYGINLIIADNYKMEFLRPLFEAEGFEIEIIRRPRSIHGLLAPRIEDAFANNRIIYGDNPLMRWYTWNVLVQIKPDGLKEYVKKDQHKRKTDGFMAFVNAMYKAAEVLEIDYGDFMLDEIVF